MLKKIGYLLLLSLFAVGLSAPAAKAGWFDLIPPGSEVIDIGRLNDSITLTAKAALEAAQTLEMYQKRFLANTGIEAEASQAASLISELGEKQNSFMSGLLGPLNRSLTVTNPAPNSDNSNSVWRDYKALTDAELLSSAARSNQKGLTRAAEENAYKDILSLSKNSLATNAQVVNQVNQVGTMAADGVLGQKQAAIISRGLIVTMQNSAMAADSAMDAAESTRMKGEILQSQTDERLSKTSELGAYDPYSRTAEDNRLSPATNAMGFARF